MITDLRFAFRQLLKTPGFTLLALITLALGIGLNTAIFSLINDLFLRGLPFKEPARVVHMYSNARERNLLELAVSAPRFQHYRDGQTIFDGFGGENAVPFTLTGLGDPVQLFGGKVTSNYFDVLGVHPVRGRNFLPEEEENADVAMVTENFWQKRMGGDANVIGRSITLDGVPHTIVGVLPNLRFSARGRAIKSGNDDRTGAGRDAAARAKLPQAISRQDRQLIGHDSQNAARRCRWKSAAGVRHFARGSGVRIAHCVQQRCKSLARALHRPSARDRVAHGAGGVARECVATFHFRKFARKRFRGSNRCRIGVAVGSARPENGGELS